MAATGVAECVSGVQPHLADTLPLLPALKQEELQMERDSASAVFKVAGARNFVLALTDPSDEAVPSLKEHNEVPQ